MKAYSVPGFSNNKDLDIIYEWAKTVPKNGVIVELGSMVGRTAVAFAEGADPSVKIYCIDYFDKWTNINSSKGFEAPGGDYWVDGKVYDTEIEFQKFTSEYKNIIQLKLPKKEIVYQYNYEPIDLLFLDCAHKNPSDIMNIMYFKKYLTNNALICGHDYAEQFPDIKKNVRVLEKMYNAKVTLYHYSTCWAIRIKQ